VAALRPEETNAAGGELKYEHFSVKLHKSKRIAIFTATNIDGKTYLTVDRDTGQVTDGPEGDKWFNDPRIPGSAYLDQSFYGDWSDYFDRGHLTRRTDPTWGTAEQAERANADTFHFTNCSPQHFRFNETAKFWQGVERFVLENGLLADDDRKPICVFQGPIFNSQIDLWADNVQIPSSFWKIVVWKGADKLKAVGLVVDQLPLLGESRKSLGQPQALPSVDVNIGGRDNEYRKTDGPRFRCCDPRHGHHRRPSPAATRGSAVSGGRGRLALEQALPQANQ
jgi:endonuclease G